MMGGDSADMREAFHSADLLNLVTTWTLLDSSIFNGTGVAVNSSKSASSTRSSTARQPEIDASHLW